MTATGGGTSKGQEGEAGTSGKEDLKTELLPCCRCGQPSRLQCPKCIQLGLPRATSVYCSQDCFKDAWNDHKKVHTPSADAWLYCIKRGKGRSQLMPDFNWTGALRPYKISPTRKVPDAIARPDYARHPDGYPKKEQESKQQQLVPIRTEEDLPGLRAACRLGREVLDAAHRMLKPGVTTDEIDRVVHDMTIEAGAYPSPLNYFNFPKSVCTSVNEVICHGIPDQRELQAGDIVNVDVTAYLGGFHGDLNETFIVGKPEEVDEASKKLCKAAYECLMLAIGACKPGMRYRDIGEIVTKHANVNGLSVVKTYCGHGIGDLFHCAPNIPHYAGNKAVGVMKEGHVFTIEPMINAGGWRDTMWPDGWTAVTSDGSRSAQYEHTMVVTKTGVEILTARLPTSPPFFWETQ